VERLTPGATIKYIRGDADKAFGTVVQKEEEDLLEGLAEDHYVQLGHKSYVANIFTRYLSEAGIELFLSPSPYVNKSRVVDRAIRTVRDNLGENPNALFNHQIVSKVVELYNKTPHSAFNREFSPIEVQMHPDLEEYYIRQQLSVLKDVKELQRNSGFFDYEPGDVLLIHLDESKTEKSMVRKRRVFNRLAVFSSYENGNVLCKRLLRSGGKIVVQDPYTILLPIYFTKYLVSNVNDIPQRYHQLIF
jgi:hypothetical protein